MTSNHRIVTTGDEWMRDMERRVGRQERRPAASSLKDVLGPGITQQARQVADWNDVELLRNGWYYSDSLGINSPDPSVAWIGMTVSAYDGRGLQRLWELDPGGREYSRHFFWNPTDPTPTFTDWAGLPDVDWTDVTLSNGWLNYGIEPAGYSRLGGMVYWRGMVSSGTTTDDTIIVAASQVPVGFAPATVKHLPAATSAGGGTLKAYPDGSIRAGAPVSATWTSLASIFYRAEA